MSRRFSCLLLFLLVGAGFAVARAQDQNDPLNEDEVQAIRDSKINPNERIKLYLKFIDQRLDAIKQLSASGKSAKDKAQIHDKFEEFTHLCDELQDNLDTYNDAHADIRKSLKDVIADTERWPTVLNAVGPDPNLEFSQKTALEAARSAMDEAHQMAVGQQLYFEAHKKERGGTGTGPD
jgi:hypothetical protein